jgi:hypothetical protein
MNRRYPILLALIAGVSPAHADDGQQAQAALARCLDKPDTPEPNGESVASPPGLSRNQHVEVVRISQRLFAYSGTSPHEISCGIAFYGPVSDAMRNAMFEMIQNRAHWVAQPRPLYSFPGAAQAKLTYWGTRLAPGAAGILMMERNPSADAPTLEIDYHVTLMR